MKKALSAVLVGGMIVAGSYVSAKTLIVKENFDNTNIRFERIHHINDKLNVYSLDETFNPVAGDLTQQLTTYVRGRNEWMAQQPSIDPVGPLGEHKNVMSFGTSTVDEVDGWTGWYGHQNLVYTTNEPAVAGEVSFKYLNDRVGRGVITVMVEEVDDHGVRQWVETFKFAGSEESTGWQNLVVPAYAVESMLAGRTFNRVHICEWDIGTGGNSYIDDVVITFETPDDDVSEVKYDTIEKAGWYVAEFSSGTGQSEIFVGGQSLGYFTEGLVDLGNLAAGDSISIMVDGWGADEVVEYDWQSWGFNFSNSSVTIHKEDPPIQGTECDNLEQILTYTYNQGYSEAESLCVLPEPVTETVVEYVYVPVEVVKEVEVVKHVNVPVEVIKEVEVPVEVVKSVCDTVDYSELSDKDTKDVKRYCSEIGKWENRVSRLIGTGVDNNGHHKDLVAKK